MKKSNFLTEIAKTYNPKIDEVFFCSSNYLNPKAWGEVHTWKGRKRYRILLNENMLSCPIRVLHVLFHEIGHIVLNHPFKQPGTLDLKREWIEAEEWAFDQMKTIDQEGMVKRDLAFCYVCLSIYSTKCFKGLNESN